MSLAFYDNSRTGITNCKTGNLLVSCLRKKNLGFEHKLALVEGERSVTFGTFWDQIDILVNAYRKRGVQKGYVVGVVSPMPSIRQAMLWMALLEVEAVPLMVDLSQKMRYVDLSDVSFYGLIVDRQFITKITSGRKIPLGYAFHSTIPEDLVWLTNTSNTFEVLTDTAFLVTSSGTTGEKKIIKYSTEGVLFNIRQNIKALRLQPEDNTLMVLPMSYSYGLVGQFLSHLMVGATIFFSNKNLFVNSILKLIDKHKVSSVFTAPPIFRQLVYLLENYQSFMATKYDWSCLRYVTVGGDSIESNSLCKGLSLLNCTIIKTYGLAEAGPRVSANFIRYKTDDMDHVGKPLEGVGVKVYGSDGKPFPVGLPGQLVVDTPAICQGYLFRHSSNMMFEGQRIFTNDIGLLLPDGSIKVLGRKSDRMEVGKIHQVVWRADIDEFLYSNFQILKLKTTYSALEDAITISIMPIARQKITVDMIKGSIADRFGMSLAKIVNIQFSNN